MMPQRVDELALAHAGAMRDADFLRLVAQFRHRPFLVPLAAAALAPQRTAAARRGGVRDARGRLPAVALRAQLFVELGILDARTGLLLRHDVARCDMPARSEEHTSELQS